MTTVHERPMTVQDAPSAQIHAFANPTQKQLGRRNPLQRLTVLTPRTIDALIEPQMLASLGWDEVREQVVFPSRHAEIGQIRCPCCDRPPVIGSGAVCKDCRRLWHAQHSALTEQEFVASGAYVPRGATVCCVCNVPGAEREPVIGRHTAYPLCARCSSRMNKLKIEPEEYVSRAEPSRNGGACAVVACDRFLSSVGHPAEPGEDRPLCSYHRNHYDGSDWPTFVQRQLPRNLFATVVLRGLPVNVQQELLAVLCMLGRNGKRSAVTNWPSLVAAARQQQVHSIFELETLIGGRSNATGRWLSNVQQDLRRATVPFQEEFKRDTWDLKVFGYPKGFLHFNGAGRRRSGQQVGEEIPAISQPWLRETAKAYLQTFVARKASMPDMYATLRGICELSVVLSMREDNGLDPAALGHDDLISFMTYCHTRVAQGDWSDTTRYLRFVEARQFLSDLRPLKLNGPGKPAQGLAEDFAFVSSDVIVKDYTPLEDEGAAAGLPDVVMQQLLDEQNMAALARLAWWLPVFVEIIADVGRRPGELLSLPFDPVSYDEVPGPDGTRIRQPVLVYRLHKSKRKHRLAVRSETVDAIRRQQQALRERYPDSDVARLPLFPSTSRSNRTGYRQTDISFATKNFRFYVDGLERLDSPDLDLHGHALPYPRLSVTLYSFRHSYAQRLVEANVAPQVLSELMGHINLATATAYYRITATMTREAVNRIRPLELNAFGRADSTGAVATGLSLPMPLGRCVNARVVRAQGRHCPLGFRCTGCGDFRTDPSFLPELEDWLERRLAHVEMLAAMGDVDAASWALDAAAPSDDEVDGLRHLIREIKRKIQCLPEDGRLPLLEAIAHVRRAREGLRDLIPGSVVAEIRQPRPLHFPDLEVGTP